MNKFTILGFMRSIFDEEETARQAAEIGQAMLSVRSLRLTDLAAGMRGKPGAAYKRLQRFVRRTDPRAVLGRLFQEQAEFVIGDPTEIERPQARKTEYVGTLKDGKTKGFWALLLATPYRGRAIPCGLVTYSSKTIAAGEEESRNLNHARAFAQIKEVLGDRPLVLDREFSYLELLLKLIEEQLKFVIRLNLGSHAPKFYDDQGQEVKLSIAAGETVIHRQVWYRGKARVNLIGRWTEGLSEPLWVITNLPAEDGLRLYFGRMKIEQSFRDLKDLLGLTKLMNKKQEYMEKMIALLLIVFAIGLLLGEGLRDQLYGEAVTSSRVPKKDRLSADRRKGKKWRRYSGLFVLLRQRWALPPPERTNVLRSSLLAFTALVQCPVRT